LTTPVPQEGFSEVRREFAALTDGIESDTVVSENEADSGGCNAFIERLGGSQPR